MNVRFPWVFCALSSASMDQLVLAMATVAPLCLLNGAVVTPDLFSEAIAPAVSPLHFVEIATLGEGLGILTYFLIVVETTYCGQVYYPSLLSDISLIALVSPIAHALYGLYLIRQLRRFEFLGKPSINEE